MVNTRLRTWMGAVLLCVVCFTGCDCVVDAGSISPADSVLPPVEIVIDDESLADLVNNTYADYYVPVSVQISKETYDAGMRNQGHVSRSDVRKSYKLKFNDEDLYEDRQKKMILSAQLRDPSFMRYILALRMYEAAGLWTLQADHCAIFINSVFNGVYLKAEPVDEYFFSRRGVQPGNLYKAVEGRARFSLRHGYQVRSGFEKKINEDDNYRDIENLLYTLDTTPDSCVEPVLSRLVDIENVCNYLAVSVLINNWDGFFHNFYFFHDPASDRFVFIPYDLDMTFGVGCTYENMHVNGHMHKGINALFERILSCPQWRSYYKDRLEWLLHTVFTPEYLTPLMDEMYARLNYDYERDGHNQRVGNNLKAEMAGLQKYITERSVFIKDELERF